MSFYLFYWFYFVYLYNMHKLGRYWSSKIRSAFFSASLGNYQKLFPLLLIISVICSLYIVTGKLKKIHKNRILRKIFGNEFLRKSQQLAYQPKIWVLASDSFWETVFWMIWLSLTHIFKDILMSRKQSVKATKPFFQFSYWNVSDWKEG